MVFSIKDCGIMLEPQLGLSMDQLVRAAKLTEELGYGYVFRSDHLLPTDNRRGIDSPECWTSLGALAASTKDLKFGPMVTPIGFRNPALLAKMACTIHSYSQGRLQLGLGAGWYEPEYVAHGLGFPNFKNRVAQFNEALDIILGMIETGRVDYDGRFFSAHTDCLPRPSGDVHTIIGAKSASIVRMAAKRADEWNIFVAQEEEYKELKAAFDGALDGKRVVVSETGPFMIGKNQAELESNAAQHARSIGSDSSPKEVLARIKGRNSPCGTVDDFVRMLRAKADGGVLKYYFQTLTPQNRDMLEVLADTLKGAI